MADTQTVKSPCVSVCTMDDLTGLCLGCYRTVEEIDGWWDLSPEKQQAVVDAAAARQSDQANFD